MSESIAEARPQSLKRGRRRLKRPRNADPNASTRLEILKSAAKAFRRLGYHGATVEQIAAALQMKKGNLYYYFKNKEEILFACHQYSLDRLLQLLDDVEHSDLPPDEKLRRLVVAFVHTILDELHGTALFLELESLTPAHLKAVIVRRDKFDHNAGGPFAQRMKSSGYPYKAGAENIGAGYHTLAEAFSGWRDSPPHRANMLLKAVTQMGIAAVYDPNTKYKVFWALIVAAPLDS